MFVGRIYLVGIIFSFIFDEGFGKNHVEWIWFGYDLLCWWWTEMTYTNFFEIIHMW
jgi:hypothetical protein